MNYNSIYDISDPELIVYRLIILSVFHKSFHNKKLLNDIIERDIYLIYLLYNKWTINT